MCTAARPSEQAGHTRSFSNCRCSRISTWHALNSWLALPKAAGLMARRACKVHHSYSAVATCFCKACVELKYCWCCIDTASMYVICKPFGCKQCHICRCYQQVAAATCDGLDLCAASAMPLRNPDSDMPGQNSRNESYCCSSAKSTTVWRWLGSRDAGQAPTRRKSMGACQTTAPHAHANAARFIRITPSAA